MTETPSLDGLLLKMMEGLPREPRRYELRCHPDVYIALRNAEPAADYMPSPSLRTGFPVYGSADIIVRSELGSGGWELYENGELRKAGRLDDPRPAYGLLHGSMHRHAVSGPAWRQHEHLGGGIPHIHDPETGFQVELRDA